MTRMEIFRFTQMKKKLANCHAVDQTCITYLCIPGESSSKTHSHFILHLAFNFQGRSMVGNRERLCQANWFQKFPLLHYDTRLVRFFGMEGATEKRSRQKPCEIPLMKEFIF